MLWDTGTGCRTPEVSSLHRTLYKVTDSIAPYFYFHNTSLHSQTSVSFLFLSAAQTLILLLCAEDHTWKYWDYTGHRSLEWRTIWISVWKNMNERYCNSKRHISRIHSFVFIRLKSIIMKELISFVKWIRHVETSVGDFSLINYSHVKEIFKN